MTILWKLKVHDLCYYGGKDNWDRCIVGKGIMWGGEEKEKCGEDLVTGKGREV